MRIEEAKVEYLPEILQLQKTAFSREAELYDDYEIPQMMQSLEEIIREYQRRTFFVCLIDKKVVGSVRAEFKDTICKIRHLSVHPMYQNLGIGTRLLKEVENKYWRADKFELYTGHKSQKNLYLYQKLGYNPYKTENYNNYIRYIYLTKENAVI